MKALARSRSFIKVLTDRLKIALWGECGLRLLCQAGYFLVICFLARRLPPADLGVIGITMVIVQGGMLAKEIGMAVVLIAREDVSDGHWNAAFYLNALICSAVFSLIFLTVPLLAARLPGEPLVPMVRSVAVVFLINILFYVQRVRLIRMMAFLKIYFAELSGLFFFVFSACFCISQGFGVWGFVIGLVVQEILICLIIDYLEPWRPSNLNTWNGGDLLRASFVIWFSKQAKYAIDNLDMVVVGMFLGPVSLGYYSLAYKLTDFLAALGTGVSRRSFLSFFSRARGDKKVVQGYYFKTLVAVGILASFVYLLMFFLAPFFIPFLFGNKWLPILLPLKVLCFAGILRCLTALSYPLLYAHGAANVLSRAGMLILGLKVGALLWGLRYGLLGVAIAVLLCEFFLFVALFEKTCEQLYRYPCRTRQELAG